jgi:hypothetical protein
MEAWTQWWCKAVRFEQILSSGNFGWMLVPSPVHGVQHWVTLNMSTAHGFSGYSTRWDRNDSSRIVWRS